MRRFKETSARIFVLVVSLFAFVATMNAGSPSNSWKAGVDLPIPENGQVCLNLKDGESIVGTTFSHNLDPTSDAVSYAGKVRGSLVQIATKANRPDLLRAAQTGTIRIAGKEFRQFNASTEELDCVCAHIKQGPVGPGGEHPGCGPGCKGCMTCTVVTPQIE